MSKPAKMRVVIVEPGKYTREAEIDNTLQAEQAVVGGLIDAIYPWPEDKACLILNDEGKIIPLEPNRALPEYEDVVFGTFFICGDGGENFCSLTDAQVQRYVERFRRPEIFLRTPDGIMVLSCTPEQYEQFVEPMRENREPPKHRDDPSR